MQLTSVSFENFKSFKERAQLNLNRINYLIGPNGAGKSNVLAGINLISMMVKDGHYPGPDDCFDGMREAPTTISFTAKLSEDERRKMIEKTLGSGRTASPGSKAFEFLKYEVSFLDNKKTRQKLLLSDGGGTLRLVQDMAGGDAYQLVRCALGGMDLNAEYVLTQDAGQRSDMLVGDFLESFDRDMRYLVLDMFLVRPMGERKEFPGSTPVGEDPDVSLDGENLPNQLLTLFNDRSQIQKFARKLRRLSSGEITEIDSQLKQQQAVIQLRERGRKTATAHSEISSGHHQQVVLHHILSRFREPIITIEEPELHLHAAVQKNLLDFIRSDLAGKQVIIATHSPIFVNVSDTESTFLLSKPAEGSVVTPVSPPDADLIRSGMGLSYADILHSDYLCCVEGKSEKIAIPALARELGYDAGLSSWVLDIGGYGNAKHLELLLEYLEMSGKKFFLLLDNHSKTWKHVNKLLRRGAFRKDRCHVLKGSFEDLFPSSVLVEYSRQLAQERGIAFELSEGELERRRQKGSATDILREEWRRQDSGREYPKADLAELLASAEPGDVPEAAAAVRRIMEGLGVAPAR